MVVGVLSTLGQPVRWHVMYLAGCCAGCVNNQIHLSGLALAVVGCIGHVELCVRRFGMMRVQMLPLAAQLNPDRVWMRRLRARHSWMSTGIQAIESACAVPVAVQSSCCPCLLPSAYCMSAASLLPTGSQLKTSALCLLAAAWLQVTGGWAPATTPIM